MRSMNRTRSISRNRTAATKETTKREYDQAWSNLIRTWTEGLARVSGVVNDVNEESSRRFLDWSNTSLDRWKPPVEVPPGLPLGTFSVDLSEFPSGVPTDPRLKDAGPTRFELPALVPFPIRASVMIKTAESGKGEAVKLLQALMLRFLTSVPPGKVRFTIFDPVGLGENFAAFMHLADYHELLVTSRIWTETPHIEQRLLDLQAHMENVIQKYLRNEFESIEQYNSFAGEVAEPFRVLVVANFPTNFNETAARRLASIVSTGARCGVYALMSLDTKLPLPAGTPAQGPRAALRERQLERGPAAMARPQLRPVPARFRRPARPGDFLSGLAHRGREGPRRQPRGGSLRLHRPAQRRLLEVRQPRRRRCARSAAPGPPSCKAWRWARARPARADRRQDGLGQIDLAARSDHQRGAPL